MNLVLACFLFLPWPAWGLPPASHGRAWIESGHKIIALIAWEEMTPATRAKVAAALQQHPRYDKDLLRDLPDGAGEAESIRHAFAAASAWPDLVRSLGHPMHQAADHPGWHYVNIAYALEDQPVPPTPPSDQPGPHDIVQALQQSVADLQAASTTAADKAIALCWLLHLVGDIHQPLHACTLFSPQFPTGDQGGNAFVVLRDPPYGNSQMNLHLLWDSLPGSFKSECIDAYLAAGLRADPRFQRGRLRAALAVQGFAAWAQESHELAIEHAYLKGTLKGITVRELRGDGRGEVPGVPRGYVERAEQVAMQRVVLAGYRTADLLNSIFDPR